MDDCELCKSRGVLLVTECPQRFVGRDVWDCVDLSAEADKGAWPIGGGTLDQTESFLNFRSQWRAALERAKAARLQHG